MLALLVLLRVLMPVLLALPALLVPVLLVLPALLVLLVRLLMLRQGMSCSAAAYDSSLAPPGRLEALLAPELRWALSNGCSRCSAGGPGLPATYRQMRKQLPQRSFCTPLRGGGSLEGTKSLWEHHWHCTNTPQHSHAEKHTGQKLAQPELGASVSHSGLSCGGRKPTRLHALHAALLKSGQARFSKRQPRRPSTWGPYQHHWGLCGPWEGLQS